MRWRAKESQFAGGRVGARWVYVMSFAEVMQQLPAFTVAERQMLVRQALELDDPGMSAGDVALVEERLAAYHADPASASVALAEHGFPLT